MAMPTPRIVTLIESPCCELVTRVADAGDPDRSDDKAGDSREDGENHHHTLAVRAAALHLEPGDLGFELLEARTGEHRRRPRRRPGPSWRRGDRAGRLDDVGHGVSSPVVAIRTR